MAKWRINREFTAVLLLGLVCVSVALPVTKTEKKKEGDVQEEQHHEQGIKYDEGYDKDDPRNRPDVSGNCGEYHLAADCLTFSNPFQLQLEYSKYLQEVVSALENDPEFRAKLDKAEEADIRVSFIFLCLSVEQPLTLRINDLVEYKAKEEEKKHNIVQQVTIIIIIIIINSNRRITICLDLKAFCFTLLRECTK